jgi:hypothetical protein
MDTINVIEKKIYADGEPYYFNTVTEEKYGEIVGGLAWPETKDGFLLIAAVDLFANNELEDRHIRVLAGANESITDNFLKRALELQRHFSPLMETIRFYGDTTSPAMMEVLDHFNRDRRSRCLDPFYLTEAPQLKAPNKHEFYAHLIKKYTDPAKKILHFCDTTIPRYLLSLFREERSKRVLNHPPVAALGYALAVLSTWRPRKRETEMKAKYESVLKDNSMEETTCQFEEGPELPK